MGGTLYEEILSKAGHLSFIQDYLNGNLDRDTFRTQVEKNRDHLVSLGLTGWWVSFLSRFPQKETTAAEQLLAALLTKGAISTSSFNEQEFLEFREIISKKFSHMPDRYTTICPEETRAAFALSTALNPSSVFVAGSYYGYLAVWMIPGLAVNGWMVCADVDPEVSEVARRNVNSLDCGERVKVVCEDAEKLLKNGIEPIDILVLDAYGSHKNPDPRYHGKAIYGPLLKAALPRLHSGSYLLVHNVEEGSGDLAEFFELVGKARLYIHLKTTDNLALFQL